MIKCKRKNLNHERNKKYDKFKEVPLASKGWKDKKAKDDYFTIHIYNNASCIFEKLFCISCFNLYNFLTYRIIYLRAGNLCMSLNPQDFLNRF